MPNRRILSLWFPRLGADRLIRSGRGPVMSDQPFVVVRDTGQAQVVTWLSPAASARGLTAGQPIRDARALCPGLITHLHSDQADAFFLASLRRWAGKFTPWVGVEPPASLVLDITGCAHLFGGEEGLVSQINAECTDLGLAVRAGLADTVGAAWALARYAGRAPENDLNGDAIDQEARATRSRAAKRRHWERGGAAPSQNLAAPPELTISIPGKAHMALSPLPVAALRLDQDTTAALARVGLKRVSDVIGMPRAALARRFGRGLVKRLDQALGREPEPVSPLRADTHFAVRLTLPDPIGLAEDLIAGIDRLLPALCAKLQDKGRGARRIRLQAFRADQGTETFEVGLARPTDRPAALRPLLLMKLDDIDAGFGIDTLRIEAHVTEPLTHHQHKGQLDAARAAIQAQALGTGGIDALVGRLGTRIGLEAMTRLHPADSHLPEKGAQVLAAAWSEPASTPWPALGRPRPLLLWAPEPVHADGATPRPPIRFRWRGRRLCTVECSGPERIAPEWWLDDPNWRTGVRDYWQLTCAEGERLWLFYAHGGTMSAGWFCHGSFC